MVDAIASFNDDAMDGQINVDDLVNTRSSNPNLETSANKAFL